MDEQNAGPGAYPVDELAEVRRLLAEPLPTPDVVEAARAKLERVTLNRGPVPVRSAGEGWRPPWTPHAAAPRRWPGWLAPVAAAAAVAAVVTASVAVSAMVKNGPVGATARKAAANAQVPRFFVSIPYYTGPATVAATGTGAVLGTVAPPRQDPRFVHVAGAGDGRTFVFAAAPRGTVSGPDRFYRLVLDQSGHPGRLTPLSIPAEPRLITGLALSPDGSKLAMSVLGPKGGAAGAKLKVFSLGTGAEHDWVWPGSAWIGWPFASLASNWFVPRSLSWGADNRSLLFEAYPGSGNVQPRILDTAAPGSDLKAASKLVPIPRSELYPQRHEPPSPFFLAAPPMITGDGTKVVAPTTRDVQGQKPKAMLVVGITEFSVTTGKPVREFPKQTIDHDSDADVLWVNASGTELIASRPRPKLISQDNETVLGVQTPATFAALPPGVQHFAQTGQLDW